MNATEPYKYVNIGWRQAITWANVDPDLCCHLTSLGLNELNLNLTDDMSTLVGNKPLPKPMLTQIFAAIWRH